MSARLIRPALALAGRRGAAPQEALPVALLELARAGAAPLSPPAARPLQQLSIAALVPSFRRGSGGHATIVRLLRELRARGHEASLWLEDCEGRHARERAAVTKRSFAEFFGAHEIELHTDTGSWRGADVVLATGWQTVPRALLLEGAGARAYLVQDHEPDFYGASAQSLWAQWTYRQGLHCIAASAWLARLLRERYGAGATHFDLGVDHATYAPPAQPSRSRPIARERPGDSRQPGDPPQPGGSPSDAARPGGSRLVVFYARAVTPRRAVPLGLLALHELARRHPDVEIALFGEDRPLNAPFAHANLGVLDGPSLRELYARASAGMVLSLTNPSLIGLEMMACGLPCVELASEPMLATFGRDGPLQLTEPDPLALCAALERLLEDPDERERIGSAGVELARERTWSRAAAQVEHGLRHALSAPVS